MSLIPLAAIEPEPAWKRVRGRVPGRARPVRSDGEFYTFFAEQTDRYDTVEWTRAQDWCDGAVGMAGRSYGATCSGSRPSEQPAAPAGDLPGRDGQRLLPRAGSTRAARSSSAFNLFWLWMMSEPSAAEGSSSVRHLPLKSAAASGPEWARFYAHWLEHPTDDSLLASAPINRRYGGSRSPR